MTAKNLRWSMLGFLACWTLVPTALSFFFGFQDFFQDWASARNWWEGIAVYSPHSETVQRYLGVDFDTLPDGKMYHIVATVKLNAHPPSSVLFYLPFALLPYRLSFVVWNLLSGLFLGVSAAIVMSELQVLPSRRVLRWLGVLGLLGGPIFEQMFFGQTNAITVLFLVLAWQAHRRGWQGWEGLWLGAAASLKLFPLVLLIVPLASRRWRTLGTAAAVGLAIAVACVSCFGFQIWGEYARTGMSEAVIWSDLWPNASISAFWKKLFISQNRGIPVKIWGSQLHYWIGYAISTALVGLTTVGLTAWRRAKNPDASYALGICAMLLLSPTCWPHYFLMLLVPLTYLWTEYRESVAGRRTLITCFVLLFLPAGLYLGLCGKGWDDVEFVVLPKITLTALAVQTYALLGLWFLIVKREVEALHGVRAQVDGSEVAMVQQRAA